MLIMILIVLIVIVNAVFIYKMNNMFYFQLMNNGGVILCIDIGINYTRITYTLFVLFIFESEFKVEL